MLLPLILVDVHGVTVEAIVGAAPEGGFTAYVPSVPGANTQGETLDEVRENVKEAVELILACRDVDDVDDEA